ncbi:MAG: hypothetical protein V4667_10530 [Bacteroidota bacterium]
MNNPRLLTLTKSFIIIVFSVVLFNSCDNLPFNRFTEGVISYEISYPNPGKNESIISMMPSTMVYKFKDNKTSGELTGNLGIFGTSLISDYENKTLYQTLKVLGKKFCAELHQKEVDDNIAKEPKMNIVPSKETKQIAGYTCKKATVIFDDKTIPSFDIYYTNEIKIEKANWYTPFKEIDGVLLEYRVKRYNIEMQFTATSVEHKEIEDDVFILTSDYKKISIAEMDEMFLSFN